MKPEIPADLTALSEAEFSALQSQVAEYARGLLADDATSAADLIEAQGFHAQVTAEGARRTEQVAAATSARQELASALTPVAPATAPAPFPDEPPAAPAPAPEAQPAAVTAAQAPAVIPQPTIDEPPASAAERYAVLLAAADAPHGANGELTSFAQVGQLLETQFARYGRATGGSRAPRPIGGSRFAIGGRSMVRHNIASIRRQYAPEFRLTESGHDATMKVINRVRDESQLPGRSLAQSALKQVEAGRALTAAAGWCAPSEIIYELCSLATLDGLLDLPTMQASRGGFQIPELGGPNFSTIYDSIGDEGDVILSEYDVENGAEKVCVEVPCPDFVDVRLDVAYLCLTGNLLQQRGYPEAVTQFSQQAIIALAHKINQSVIARMVTAAGPAEVIAADASGDDAASALLAAAELAILDMRYRHRMSMSATVEVVLPAWIVGPFRAALSRARGVRMMDVSDAQIVQWFAIRGARVQFVYDWQDAFSGGAFGAQDSAAAFPTTVDFLVYPAGTFVKGEQDVVSLDTIYDNAMLTQNQFTALFVEDGFSVMQMCADARLYTASVDPSGVTGCCP